MEDSAEDVERKIMKAYCPTAKDAEADLAKQDNSMSLVEDTLKNPILDYVKYIVMSNGDSLTVSGKTYATADDVKA